MLKMSIYWDDVRSMCIKHQFYCSGDNYAYSNLASYIDNIDSDTMTEYDIELIRNDIAMHSNWVLLGYQCKEELYNHIEWLLLNECIKYTMRG